ncbi:MAG: NADH-dependent flavin oxidoreductase [Ignavibacteriae bacterium]|nr:NADH-dependent flavin oxidoreductase [Ignavibacteriota bacterium]
MNDRFAPLFDTFEFRSGVRAANRIAVAPMTTWSSYPDGTIHPDELRYIARRAHGPGLFVTAACYVNPAGHAFPGQWGCHDDDMLPSLRSGAAAITSQGALAILQIHHGGRMCPATLLGHAPLCASAVAAARPGADTPREMSDEEIRNTIQDFARATSRAVEAGYDGVEIHGANTYLQQQFFSPHSNRRHDFWGGSLEARMRFPLATLDAVLEAASAASRPFAVGYRLSPEEIEEPGITLEDTLALVDAICERPLDYLHVSTREYSKGSLRDRSDARTPTSRIISRVVGRAPVIGVGKLIQPDDVLHALGEGCSFAALGRAMLYEPEWVEKVLAGREGALCTALPVEDAENLLTIPAPLCAMLLSVKGWIPVSH